MFGNTAQLIGRNTKRDQQHIAMMNEYVNEKRVYDHRGKDMIAINYIHLLEAIAGRDVAGCGIKKEIEGNLITAFE